MWAYDSVFYQIYPLGMCGAPFENDGVLTHRILSVLDWIPHLTKLGVNAVYFSPLWESDTHGYNTRDYRKLDVRLGTNADFKKVCTALHKAGIRVVIDGVFNHVGRGFGPFQDVLEKKWESPYKDWFYINFDGNSNYNDGLWYEGWEGNFDLVKINLQHPEVRQYLLDSVKFWIEEFGIDGLRLDVAYMVDRDFLKALRYETSQWKEDFFLLGEILGGDYKVIMNDEMCHSATNYECYKGIHSSITSKNLFEILHSLLRQFGPEQWCLYRGYHLLSFVDNHDVSRIAGILKDPALVKIAYTIMFGMPGIPQIYYGSEWGYAAEKSQGDPALRPAFDAPEWNDLTDYVAGLTKGWIATPALHNGDIRSLVLENTHCIFERYLSEEERVMIAVNLDDGDYTFHFDARAGRAMDLATGTEVDFGGGLTLPGKTAMMLKPF
ncbi:MAG: cyclomaltodextrinase [Lachnospiraceae bacterium]|nr:cyclomaltodextrinase [Lachnospiraceae bacterium]